MTYGKNLLDAATAKAGSRYRLAQLTELDEGDLSKAAHGKRDIPASWVLKLARVANIDPTEAMEFHDLERAQKKRERQRLKRSELGIAVAICAGFVLLGSASDPAIKEAISPPDLTTLYIVSSGVAWLARLVRSVYQGALQPSAPAWTPPAPIILAV